MHRQGERARHPRIGWQGRVRDWFSENLRPLPWREDPTPYRVWISEVMLQQTQVVTVLPYFKRFLERFPTVESLAKAPLEAVIKLWEGLGYYSRARFLHEGAKQIVSEMGGRFPDTKEGLSKVKGIGPYTVGAILSFAYRQKAAAVDGNVIRVLSRLYALDDDISKPKTIESLRDLTLNILPDHHPWELMEGLIELGATVCNKKPSCLSCPLQKDCSAYAKGDPERYPYKSKRVKATHLERAVAVIEGEGHLLVRKGGVGKVMADLYEFPYLPKKEGEVSDFEAHLNLALKGKGILPEISHTFTRFRVRLYPEVFAAKRTEITDYEWVAIESIEELPFSAGHRKILNFYLKNS